MQIPMDPVSRAVVRSDPRAAQHPNRRVHKLTRPAEVVGLVIDASSVAGNLHFMSKRIAQTFEPEVVEVDDFWVHVAVSPDAHLSKRFQAEVSLYSREADSQWADLDLRKPAEAPRALRAFTTPEAAYEHGIALGHTLTSIY